MTWTWDDLVDMVCELMVENTVETHLYECDEHDDGSAPSLEFTLEHEIEMFFENLDEDIWKNHNKILENIKKKLDEEGYDYKEE